MTGANSTPTSGIGLHGWGLLHLLAVSGLHVMVVGMAFYHLMGPLLRRMRIGWRVANAVRISATMGLLGAYMLLTGCSASVVRAVVMAGLWLCSNALQRSTAPLNILAAAVCILLVARPTHLFEAGFQLSVSAVAAILIVTPHLAARIPSNARGFVRYAYSSAAVTVAATIGTLPVTLYHFGQVGLAGLLLNLPGIPITTAALTAGVTAVLFGSMATPLGEALGASADILAEGLLHLSAFGDRFLGWSVIRWRIHHPLPVVSISLLTASLATWQHKRLRWRFAVAGLALLATHLTMGIVSGRYTPSVDLIQIDVGQGDATLLRLPNGNGVLIDAGPRSPFGDAGSRFVLPQLAFQGVRHLSALVITHPDRDHLGGVPSVLRSVPVGRVLRSGFQHTSYLFAEANRMLDSLGVPHRAVHAGDTLAFAPNVRGYVLHPFERGGR